MRGLGSRKFWCHLSASSNKRYTNKEIRDSSAISIKTFPELVGLVARIANHNPDYALFFRGQPKDYKIKNGQSSCYPTIFRSAGKSLSDFELSENFRLLSWCSKELLTQLQLLKVDSMDKLRKFPELRWSILQHYGVCNTPLLDVTHSLRVAASFALLESGSDPHILVLALPYPNGTISYSTEEELQNIRLLSASPSVALRPHFQEGYLLGTFPAIVEKKQNSLDFGKRVISKIKIPRTGFWTTGFHAIPRNALYPDSDNMSVVCKNIARRIETEFLF